MFKAIKKTSPPESDEMLIFLSHLQIYLLKEMMEIYEKQNTT